MYRGREKGSINNIPIATFQLALSWKLPIIKLTINTQKNALVKQALCYQMLSIKL